MATILIVDDDTTKLDLLSTIVGLLGHQAVQAHSGSEALDLLLEHQPDLILLDLMMPRLDGYETMRRIRSGAHSPHVPIVVVTASQEADVEERVAESGGDRVCFKPVSIPMLTEAVAELVEPDPLASGSALARDV